MNDASEKNAQQTEAAPMAANRDDRSAAVEALNAAIEATRGNPALQGEHATALVRLGVLEQELGRPAEAERLLTEAITAGERNLGAEHPSLGVALNHLSRLYIRQSDFSRAEPVLKRLLHIARAKGDSHPDVATALAGLAVAKRGLGENAAAEVLYRHALRIREEVLAPDHMAIVVTLEQLAETCATRGRVAEALVHLQRALLKRERALGVDHATVRGLSARIADLERRVAKSGAKAADRPATPPAPAAEVAMAPAAPPMLVETPPLAASPSAPPTPDWRATPARPRFFASTATQPQPSGELKFLYQPVPAAPGFALPTRERASTSAHSVFGESPVSETVALSARTQSTTLARTAAPAVGDTLPQPAGATMSPAPAIADAPMIGSSSRDISDLFASIKRTILYASAGAAVIALAIASSDVGSPGESESELAPGSTDAASYAADVTPASHATSQTTLVASVPEARRGGVGAPMPRVVQPKRESESPEAMPSEPVAVPSLRRIVVPKVATPSVDSLMRTAAKVGLDTDSERITAGEGLLGSAHNDDASVTRPMLISAPTMRFPDELRAQRVEGEVVVQFRVNEKGRVDASSMQVLQSEHELFTEAVRSVLPKFRFEPARSSALGSKPQAAWVQFRAQFTARK